MEKDKNEIKKIKIQSNKKYKFAITFNVPLKILFLEQQS